MALLIIVKNFWKCFTHHARIFAGIFAETQHTSERRGKIVAFLKIEKNLYRGILRDDVHFFLQLWPSLLFLYVQQFFHGTFSTSVFSNADIFFEKVSPCFLQTEKNICKKYNNYPRFLVHPFQTTISRKYIICVFSVGFRTENVHFGGFTFSPLLRNFARWPPIFFSYMDAKYHSFQHIIFSGTIFDDAFLRPYLLKLESCL